MAGLERHLSAATEASEATIPTVCPSKSPKRTTSTSSTRDAAWTLSGRNQLGFKGKIQFFFPGRRLASDTTADSAQGSSSTRSRQFSTPEPFTQTSQSALSLFGAAHFSWCFQPSSWTNWRKWLFWFSGCTRTDSWRPSQCSLSSTWETCFPWRSFALLNLQFHFMAIYGLRSYWICFFRAAHVNRFVLNFRVAAWGAGRGVHPSKRRCLLLPRRRSTCQRTDGLNVDRIIMIMIKWSHSYNYREIETEITSWCRCWPCCTRCLWESTTGSRASWARSTRTGTTRPSSRWTPSTTSQCALQLHVK